MSQQPSSQSLPLEVFLAGLYTDAALRTRFLADRTGEAHRAGLSVADQAAVLAIDANDLRLAARSFAHKRHQKEQAHTARANRAVRIAAPLSRRWKKSLLLAGLRRWFTSLAAR